MSSVSPDRNTLPAPRALAWRGHIDAAALLLLVGTGLLTRAEARRRALSLWSPGTVVFEEDTGDLLLLFPTPLARVRTEEAPGTPAVRLTDGLLCTAPATPAEIERLRERARAAGASRALAQVRAGSWDVVALTPSQTVDPAAWLDLGDATVEGTPDSLGAPPAAVVDALPPAAFDRRTAYGKAGVGDPPPELTGFLAALRGRPTDAAHAPRQGTGAGSGTSLGASLLRFADNLLSGARSSTGTGPNRSSHVEDGKDPLAWLRRAAAHLAGRVGLGRLIGKQQAEYLRKILDLFERGDLEQALRHAIPLGGEADGLLKSLPPSLFTPRPRADLSLTAGRVPAATALGVSPDLHDLLRSLYRRAFERLDREGRTHEAAFVLAELLSETEEAVDYLEKHGRLSLAADMAEARGLPPGWVVRLRFLAGDTARAIAYARRTGAWGEAIAQLERRPDRRNEAKSLRLEWAASLARAGEYGQAIEVAAPVAEAQPLVREWTDRVVEAGGVPAARMRARRLAWFPDAAAPEGRAEALALLSEEAAATARERRAFLEEITRPDAWNLPHAVPLQRALARAGFRTLARDTALGLLSPPSKSLYNGLLTTANDPLLKTDAPTLAQINAAAPGDVRHRALRERSPGEPPHVCAPSDVGLLPVHDAAHLPSGRTLVALGEAGVRLLAPDGRTLRDWATVPAQRLVPADSGNVAVALARRGSLWRLTHLDIATGAARPWCEAHLSAFAPDSDGSVWMVALPHGGATEAITAIDLQGPPDRLAALWRTPLDSGRFVCIARTATACAALALDVRPSRAPSPLPGTLPRPQPEAHWEVWRLDMPSLTMRERGLWETQPTSPDSLESAAPLPVRNQWQGGIDLSGSGGVVVRETTPGSPGQHHSRLHLWPAARNTPPLPLGEYVDRSNGIEAAPVVVGGGWLADIRRPVGAAPPRLILSSLTHARAGVEPEALPRLQIHLEGAATVGARLSPGCLTLWDDRGRVLAFDLDTGNLRADLRIR